LMLMVWVLVLRLMLMVAVVGGLTCLMSWFLLVNSWFLILDFFVANWRFRR
jgi:hypothetical protein